MEIQNTPVPPPPPEYYVMKEGQILGPFGVEELRAAVEDGQFDVTDFVQTGGLAIWRPISRVLGVDGSIPSGAIAPDWRSIRHWAWQRLQYNIEERSISTGLVCLGIGFFALFLSSFSFLSWLIWLPWFIPAGIAAVALIRRRQVIVGTALLCAAFAVPIAASRYRLGSQVSKSPITNHDLLADARSADSPPRLSDGATHSSSTEPEPPPPNLEAAPPTPAPGLTTQNKEAEEPPPLTPPAIASAAPAPSTPPPLRASVKPQVSGVTVPSLIPDPQPTTARITTSLPPPPPPPILANPVPPSVAARPDAPPAGAGDLVQRHRDSLIVVRDREGAGSGFLCKRGDRVWLFTNNHVAAGMRQPVFTRLDGARVNVTAPESATGYDAIRFAVTENPTVPLETVATLEGVARIGDEVLVLGNSGGGGVVTSLKGELVGIGPDRIEVSAEFIPGNSGSPIIHVPSGKVIGIATYLTRKYEEFSVGGEAAPRPSAPGSPLAGRGTIVTRRFGFRLDNIARWEPVNWQAFQSEAEQLRQISALTEDVFDFLGSLRTKGEPNFATDTLRRPAQQWFDTVRKPRLSEVDKINATHSFLSSLRSLVRADVIAAEGRLRYSYFREQLAQERTVRDKLFQAFDAETRRLASPTALH